MKPRLAATALVAASACALALGACTPGDTAQSSSSPAAKGGGDGNYTIAVVPKDATNPWFVRMETGVKQFATVHDGHGQIGHDDRHRMSEGVVERIFAVRCLDDGPA